MLLIQTVFNHFLQVENIFSKWGLELPKVLTLKGFFDKIRIPTEDYEMWFPKKDSKSLGFLMPFENGTRYSQTDFCIQQINDLPEIDRLTFYEKTVTWRL